jgi:hypothetical protein
LPSPKLTSPLATTAVDLPKAVTADKASEDPNREDCELFILSPRALVRRRADPPNGFAVIKGLPAEEEGLEEDPSRGLVDREEVLIMEALVDTSSTMAEEAEQEGLGEFGEAESSAERGGS